MKIKFTEAALACIGIGGCDPLGDVYAVRRGVLTREELLEQCLCGAPPEDVDGWNDYVRAIALAAEEDV